MSQDTEILQKFDHIPAPETAIMANEVGQLEFGWFPGCTADIAVRGTNNNIIILHFQNGLFTGYSQWRPK